jgi:hypothetical protein
MILDGDPMGGVIGLYRFVGASQPPQQIGADRVKDVIAGKVESFENIQCNLRPVHLGERNSPVERDDCVRGEREQLIVERENLVPVR